MSSSRAAGLQATSGVAIAGREAILRVLLQAGIAAVLGTLALLLWVEGDRLVYWPYATLLASHLGAWWLLRSGRLRLAVLTHAAVYISTILAVLYIYGGLRSPATFVLSPVVLLVGLTWSGRAATAAATACSLGMLAMIALQVYQGQNTRGEFTYWVVATAVLFLTSVVLAVALRAIARAQAQALGAERERWALQEQLLRTQRLETVARLAAGVAHDFNNLLNVIVGQAGLLARHPDERTAEQARQIEGAAWRAADLTQKLLAVGRNREFESRELELNEVVRGIEPLLRRALAGSPPSPAGAPGVAAPQPPATAAEREGVARLQVDLDSLPLHVRGDAAGLEQILMNLVRNAGDATRDGGEIRIHTSRARPDEFARLPGWKGAPGAAIRLEVADSGSGMSPEVQAHLFEPFFSTKPAGRGNGLGLASVYGIVQQCGGAVLVESAPGRGTTFRIYLQDARPPQSQGTERASLPVV
jgi:signal transduction histidine kinase